MQKIKIIHAPTLQKPYIVLYKPKGIPSAPLSNNDKNNALSMCIELFPEIKEVHGKKDIEYGLLHRIDTPTDGLLLIATSQDFYDFMINEQAEGRFIKFYTALCEKNPNNAKELGGFPPLENKIHSEAIHITSYFRSFALGGKEVRPVTKKSGKSALKKIGKLKEYTTEINIKKEDFKIEISNNPTKNTSHNVADSMNYNSDPIPVLVECKITQGYRHQVRCHLAWVGLPIIGDELYNQHKKNCPNKTKDSSELLFTATKIEFEYPKGDLNSYEITFTWT